jgi:hypothetical protein
MNLFRVTNYGLYSTAFTALASFLFFGAVNYFLTLDDAAEFRYLLNWALSLSLIFALGWDSAITRLTMRDAAKLKEFAERVLPYLTLLACLASLWIKSDYLLISSMIMALVSVLIHYNYKRAEGNFISYIIGLNVFDKGYRLLAFLIVVLSFNEHLFALFVILYQLAVTRSPLFEPKRLYELILFFFRGILRAQNISYMLAGGFMVMASKGVYLSGYDYSDNILNSLDFVLLFCMFLLVPIQSVMKYKEISVGGNYEIILGGHDSSSELKICVLELAIVMGICAAMMLADIYWERIELDANVIAGALILHIFISNIPNPIQVLAAYHKNITALVVLLFLILAVILSLQIDIVQDRFWIYTVAVFFSQLILVVTLSSVFKGKFLAIRFVRTIFLTILCVIVWSAYGT